MRNYKGRDNLEIINEYIYLINELFFDKEVIVDYSDISYKCYIDMGLNQIELPNSCINSVINNSGIFKLVNKNTLIKSKYILNDKEYLERWCKSQVNNYLLNEPDVKSFEPAIRKLRRINNLNQLITE